MGGAPYLHSLVATVPTAAYYARIVRDKAVLRRLVEAGTRIAAMGYSGEGGEVEDLVNRGQSEVYGVGAQRVHDTFRPLSETLEATLAELEEMSGALDSNYIGKLERGLIRWPRSHYRQALRTILGARTDRDLGFAPPKRPDAGQELVSGAPVRSGAHAGTQGASGEAPSDRPWLPVPTAEIMNDVTRHDLGLSRREATRLLAAVAAGPALLEPLERWLRHPVLSATTHGGGLLNLEQLEHLEAAAYVFRQWDDTVGGGLRRKAVVGQLSEVSDILKSPVASGLRPRLLSTAARLAETAATMSWDSGLQGAAQQYYSLSVRAAYEAGDREFAAYSLAGMARQLIYLGEAADGLELARLALRIAPGNDVPALRSLLTLREAWAYAALGRPSAFEDGIERAHEAFDDSRSAPTPPWLSHFDRAEFAGTVGGRYLDLARQRPSLAATAIEWTSQAIAARPADRLRSNALDHVGLTESWIIAGDIDRAAAAGHQAVAAAARTESDRVAAQVRTLFATLDNVDHSPLAGLRDRFAPTSH